MAVVLIVAADEFILPRMMIFRGKSDKTIKEIIALAGFVIITQEKTWIGKSLIFSGLIKYENCMQIRHKNNWILTNR